MRKETTGMDKLRYIERTQFAIKGVQPIGAGSTVANVIETSNTWDLDVSPSGNNPNGFDASNTMRITFTTDAATVGMESFELKILVNNTDYNLMASGPFFVYVASVNEQFGGNISTAQKKVVVVVRVMSDTGYRMRVKARVNSLSTGSLSVAVTNDYA